MKEVLVKIDPCVVEPDDFEDLLATDDLFIEYFNAFLALPTFPEPLFFNKETGGFEIVTDAKERLATEIKAAVRAGRPRKKIYRAVRRHAFMPVPLIPMEEPQEEEPREIDTSFVVQTLNKEQGIEWIKKERLSSFLESECYLEYRLAHLVAQAQVSADLTEPVSLRLDRTPRKPPTRKPKNEPPPEPDENEEELEENDDTPRVKIPTKAKIMKDMFVCMGSASTTDTEAWVSQAKMAHTTVSSSSSSPRPRPVSAVLPPGPTPRGARPVSAAMTGGRPMSGTRPISSLSATDSMWRDSGIGSPTKLSLYGSTLDVTGYANSVVSQDDLRESEVGVGEGEAEEGTTSSGPPPHGIQSRLFRPDSKPLTPRTPRGTDAVCLVTKGGVRRGGTVYAMPPQEDDDDDDASSSASEVPTETSSQRSAPSPVPSMGQSGDLLDGTNPEDSVTTNGQIDEHTYNDLDKLGSVIVGTVLKYAIAKTTGLEPAEVVRSNQVISDLCSREKLSGLTLRDLGQLEFSPLGSPRQTTNESQQTTNESQQTTNESQMTTTSASPSETSGAKAPYFKEPPKGEVKKQELTSTTQASDSGEDSMLDSDNDYDEDRDKIFKKRKRKFKLTSKKGIENFKRFLRSTRGEKNWYFWLDVDRGRLLLDAGNITGYLAAMRERYQLPGAPYELPRETKVDLGLVEPSQWTMEKLMAVQNKVAEPLLLYWTPRFLLQQSSAARPERNYMYNLQRQSATPGECHPNPPTMGLLPLRPKTCMPRLRQMERPTMTITSMFDDVTPPKEEPKELPSTTPRVGMKRTHSLPEMYKDKKKEKEKENQERQRNAKKTPKQLVCARNRSVSSSETPRPPATPRATRSAPDRRGRASRSSDQWDTFSNLSLPSSVRSTPRGGNRPATAMSLTSDYAASEASDFLGGRRMEGLLQALASEKKAGGVIRKYLDTTGNQLWLDALAFWHELQEYHNMFYADILDVYLLEKKAKFIFSQYIVTGSPHDLHCSPQVRTSIHSHLNPPYEDLFDAAEELVLEMLFDSWSQMIVSDLSTFDKVELIEVKRHIDTRSRYMVTLQRRGIIKERPETPDDPMVGYQDPVYDESLLESIPEEFRDYTLEKLVHNRIELEHFRQFLAENYASMDILCWMDIEAFRRTPHNEERKRDHKAKDIKTKYMNKKYFFGPNSPAGKEGQEKVMAVGGGWGKLLDDRPPTASLLEAQKYVRARLEKKWLPLFLATPEFADRQRPRSSMDDVVEDVMIQKKKKSQAIWRMLESRWVSSSTDIIVFRKALLNPITSLQFRRFVSIKGDHYENDVLFWQEIQRYKDLCHLHSDRPLIQQKTVAIVNCFIDSPIPPALQVDLTQEMADRIVERKLEATPYVFREAQLTVFRVLFPYWSDFCQFRQNLAADKILPTIERHRRRAKAEERRRQEEIRERKEKQRKQKRAVRKLEKQLEKERLAKLASEGQEDTLADDRGTEMARRRALGLPVDAEEDEGYREAQHEVPSSGEEDELDVGSETGREDGTKDSQMAWSYSGYMNALEEEKVLNEVDEATFSCVSEGSSKGSLIPILFTQPNEEDVPGKEHVELTDDPPSRRGSARKSQRTEDKPRSRPNSGASCASK